MASYSKNGVRLGRPPLKEGESGKVSSVKSVAPKTPAEVRAWVIEHTSVLENVARMADGKRIKACGPTGKPIWRETSADKQQQAIFKLLGKLAPDLTYGSITNVDARTAIKVEAEPSKPALPRRDRHPRLWAAGSCRCHRNSAGR